VELQYADDPKHPLNDAVFGFSQALVKYQLIVKVAHDHIHKNGIFHKELALQVQYEGLTLYPVNPKFDNIVI